VAAQRLGVVLNPHCGRLGDPQRVDAEQECQGPVVDAEGLGDLEEPDQLLTIQAWVRDSSACTLGRRA
jgi:hypothetical protein